MANKASRPGRTLIVFGLVILAMYGGLALANTWKPKLGLDLQGGTRITLEAKTETGEAITPEKLDEAAGIIDSRVNAYGVAESEVSTQGDRNIVVEIPGQRHRARSSTPSSRPPSCGSASSPRARRTSRSPSRPRRRRSRCRAPRATRTRATKGTKGDKKRHGRAARRGQREPEGARAVRGSAAAPTHGCRSADNGQERRQEREGSPTARAAPSPPPSPRPDQPGAPTGKMPTNKSSVDELLAWARNPDPASQAAFAKFTCAEEDQSADNPAKPLLACDEKGREVPALAGDHRGHPAVGRLVRHPAERRRSTSSRSTSTVTRPASSPT